MSTVAESTRYIDILLVHVQTIIKHICFFKEIIFGSRGLIFVHKNAYTFIKKPTHSWPTFFICLLTTISQC